MPRQLLAFLLASALVVSGLMFGTTATAVGTNPDSEIQAGAVTASVTFPIGFGNTPVLPEGGQVGKLAVAYDGTKVVPGSTVRIDLPSTVLPHNLTIPVGNTAIAKLESDGSSILITFADPFPGDVNQGQLALEFKLDSITHSEKTQFEWSIGNTTEKFPVILQEENDTLQDFTGASQAKSGGGNLPGLSINTDGVVTVPPAAANHKFDFTLTGTTTTARPGYVIADQLPTGMVFDSSSFSAVVESWDADGLNKTTTTLSPFTPTVSGTAATGQRFTVNTDVPANSRIKVRYKASYDPSALDALRAELQAKVPADLDGQWIEVVRKNSATLGGSAAKTADIKAAAQAPVVRKPGTGTGTFNKTSDWAKQNVEPQPDGTLAPPIPVTWTLKANLQAFVPPANATPAEIKHATLTKNVVIKDTLPSQASWATSEADFTGLGLTKVSCSGATTADSFASTTAGSYCLDGNTLWINVGMDNTKSYSFDLKAQINTTVGLSKTASGTVNGAFNYRLTNRATFVYDTEGTAGDQTVPRDAAVTLVDRPDDTDGSFNDTDTFKKEGPKQEISLAPGTSTKIKYTFTVNGNNVDQLDREVNAADVKIVDVVDTKVFDLSNLAAIKADLAGRYNDSLTLTAADFLLTESPAGTLVIELSPAGEVKVAGTGNSKAKWTVDLLLPTRKVTGKQTIDIENNATLLGQGSTTQFWSEDVSTISSYGDEAEVRKFVRDSVNGAWTGNLRATFEDGELVKDVYVYKVEFLAHGTFQGRIFDVNDVLPAGTEFVGFVDEANADTAAGATAGPKDIGGGITASYDSSKRTMSLKATNVPKAVRTSAYFAVRIVDFDVDVPIVNKIGTAAANITPTDGYPLTIAKIDSTNPNAAISDPKARFELRDSDGTVVVDNIFVFENQLRVSVGGTTKAVKVTTPGSYTLHEMNPPAGYVKTDEVLTFEIATDKVPAAQTLYNDPVPGSVRVGDYVWIDKNHDGLQDSTDMVVPGVELKIERVDAAGNPHPVTGVNKMPVLNQTTDASGKYLFPGLPVLAANETYKVTVVTKPTMLDGFVPTTQGANNGSGATDSSTTSASTVKDLKTAGKEDLTLDFGFVKPYVRVGDYVWIDVDKDGLQDPTNDIAIKDVKLALYKVAADGTETPVTTNVYGDPIVDQVTDRNGHYVFDNLTPIPDTEQYRVKIVTTDAGTIEALKGLAPTTATEGDDKSIDSNTEVATSWKPLGSHQAEDMTLDFGFIRLAVSVGDYVWEDTNRDGSQGDQALEPGIPGVLLKVYGPDGVTEITHDVNGEPFGEVRTNAEGKYSFDNLPALDTDEQTYTVKIVTTDPQTVEALKPFVPTIAGSNGGEGTEDSSTGSSSSTVDLTGEGSRDDTLDFGFAKLYVSVGNYVWIDVDRDGLQTAGNDIAVEGVELKIELVTAGVGGDTVTDVTDVKGNAVKTTLTATNGRYEFSLLPVLEPGQTYRVSIVKESLPESLANFIPTRTTPLADDQQDIDSEIWVAGTIGTLDGTDVPGEPKDSAHVGEDLTLDFGFVQKKVSVGNIVWYDKDEDGQRDSDEELLEGVTLVLTDPAGNPVTDVFGDPVVPITTGPDGEYVFKDLPALPAGKHYTVTVDYEKSPILAEKNLVPTNPGVRGDDVDLSNDYSHTDSAESTDLTDDGDHDPTLDFGFRKAKVSVGDYVWIDVNRDGLQDRSDVPIKGVVLKLTGPDGKPVVNVFGESVGTTITNGKGFYDFKNLPVLPAGQSYKASIVKDDPSTVDALAGLVPTTANAGSDKSADSSTDSASSWIDLSKDGSQDYTLDFGFQRAAVTVGDYVWRDKNRDGKQNKSESGIEGVLLKVTGPDGKPVTDVNGHPVRPVRTDKDGHYVFAELPVLEPGQSYTVTLIKSKSKKALKGLFPTAVEKGSNKAVDSSTKTSVSWKDLTVNGAQDMTLDFGFYNGELDGVGVENPGNNGNNGNNGSDKPGTDGLLPDTGAEVAAWTIVAGLLLLIAGAGVLMRRRRES